MNLDVHLHAYGDRRYVGKLAEQSGALLFQYAPEFLDSGINISPFKLLLSPEVKEDPKRTFDGLFDAFNDSLPDVWGCFCWTGPCARRVHPCRLICHCSAFAKVKR